MKLTSGFHAHSGWLGVRVAHNTDKWVGCTLVSLAGQFRHFVRRLFAETGKHTPVTSAASEALPTFGVAPRCMAARIETVLRRDISAVSLVMMPLPSDTYAAVAVTNKLRWGGRVPPCFSSNWSTALD